MLETNDTGLKPNNDLLLFIVNDGALYQRLKEIRGERKEIRLSEYEAHAYCGWGKFTKEVGPLIGVEYSEVAKRLKEYYEQEECDLEDYSKMEDY